MATNTHIQVRSARRCILRSAAAKFLFATAVATATSTILACFGALQAAPEAARVQAWRAQQRLYRRYQRLAARGKPKQHVVTAIARELTGFVWATLTQ